METTINKDGIGTITFSEENELGRSDYARVYSGTFTTGDGTVYDVAVKRIETGKISPFEKGSMRLTHPNINHPNINHPNILRYYNSLTDDNFTYLVTELCEKHTLQNFIEPPKEAKGKRHSPCRVGSTREIMRQITRGIKYFHEIGIEHRDIKPANLLISKTFGDIPPMIRLADFEFCFKIEDTDDYQLPRQDRNGTPGFMAPELNDENQRGTPFAVDIFAAACVFCVTFSGGKHPFGTTTRDYNIRTGGMDFSIFNWRCDPLFFQLIESMLNPIPSERLTATQVLNNAFLNELLEFCKETRDWELPETILRFDDLLANKSIDANVRDEEGQTPLMLLCVKNQTSNLGDYITKLLTRIDANATREVVNARDGIDNNALLLLCIQYKHRNLLEIVQLLIEKGIDPRATDDQNWNALHQVCRNYNEDNLIDIIRLLIENGIDVTAKTSENWNALHYVCCYYTHENLIQIVGILIENHINVNDTDDKGWDALHFVCLYYYHNNLNEIVQLLKENGIDMERVNNEGLTTADLLRRRGLLNE